MLFFVVVCCYDDVIIAVVCVAGCQTKNQKKEVRTCD